MRCTGRHAVSWLCRVSCLWVCLSTLSYGQALPAYHVDCHDFALVAPGLEGSLCIQERAAGSDAPANGHAACEVLGSMPCGSTLAMFMQAVYPGILQGPVPEDSRSDPEIHVQAVIQLPAISPSVTAASAEHVSWGVIQYSSSTPQAASPEFMPGLVLRLADWQVADPGSGTCGRTAQLSGYWANFSVPNPGKPTSSGSHTDRFGTAPLDHGVHLVAWRGAAEHHESALFSQVVATRCACDMTCTQRLGLSITSAGHTTVTAGPQGAQVLLWQGHTALPPTTPAPAAWAPFWARASASSHGPGPHLHSMTWAPESTSSLSQPRQLAPPPAEPCSHSDNPPGPPQPASGSSHARRLVSCGPGQQPLSTFCVACPKGRYSSTTSSAACSTCPTGQYAATTGQSICFDCGPGRRQHLVGQSTCFDCVAGQYTALQTRSTTECALCSAGRYSYTRSSSCSSCQPGRYSAASESSSCTFCSAGYYSFASASTACTGCGPGRRQHLSGASFCYDCEPGQYTGLTARSTSYCADCWSGRYSSASAATTCELCEIGKYSSGSGRSTCTSCTPGYRQHLTGSSACNACDPGQYTGLTGRDTSVCALCSAGRYSGSAYSSCVSCSPGFYNTASYSSTCTACLAGEEQPSSGKTSCTSCQPGYRNHLTGQAHCFACDAGQYTGLVGRATSMCANCWLGTYSGSTAQTTCADCAAGRYAGSSGQTACTACSAGQYEDSTASSSCSACPAGTAQASAGQTYCSTCAAGYRQPNTGASSCVPCTAGLFSLAGNSGAQCLACNAGYTSSVAASSCSACTAGRYAPSSASSQCSQCPRGRYQPGSAAAACAACGSGYYMADTGKTACASCAAGRYQPASAASTCSDCVAGKYAATGAATSCANCAVGYYSPAGVSQCTKCMRGKYSNMAGTPECLGCAAGRYGDALGATSCAACSPGYTNAATGKSVCAVCSAGRYMSAAASAAADCTVCPAGRSSAAGSSACASCASGKYSAASGASTCTLCPAGYAQSQAGKTGCSACAAGWYAGTAGATVCAQCSAGTYQPSTAEAACLDCAPGKYMASSGSSGPCSACSAGLISASYAATGCTACAAGLFSSSSALTVCSACSPGRTQGSAAASSCALCQPGKYMASSGSSTNQCDACPVGKFTAAAGASACTDCSAGYRQATIGATSCTACAAGRFEAALGSAHPQCPSVCAAGRYSHSAASACTVCSSGYHSEATGASLCTACSAGKYSAPEASTCTACAPGYFAAASGSSACTAWATCGATEVVSEPGTATSDRVCIPASPSAAPSGSQLPTSGVTPSAVPSTSSTPAGTPSHTATSTATPSTSGTPSPTSTAEPSVSAGGTPSSTALPSTSADGTAGPSATTQASASALGSVSAAATPSLTALATPSSSTTPSSTASASNTPAATPSHSPSSDVTPTAVASNSPGPSLSPQATAANTPRATSSSVPTSAATPSVTRSAMSTPGATPTPVATASMGPTPDPLPSPDWAQRRGTFASFTAWWTGSSECSLSSTTLACSLDFNVRAAGWSAAWIAYISAGTWHTAQDPLAAAWLARDPSAALNMTTEAERAGRAVHPAQASLARLQAVSTLVVQHAGASSGTTGNTPETATLLVRGRVLVQLPVPALASSGVAGLAVHFEHASTGEELYPALPASASLALPEMVARPASLTQRIAMVTARNGTSAAAQVWPSNARVTVRNAGWDVAALAVIIPAEERCWLTWRSSNELDYIPAGTSVTIELGMDLQRMGAGLASSALTLRLAGLQSSGVQQEAVVPVAFMATAMLICPTALELGTLHRQFQAGVLEGVAAEGQALAGTVQVRNTGYEDMHVHAVDVAALLAPAPDIQAVTSVANEVLGQAGPRCSGGAATTGATAGLGPWQASGWLRIDWPANQSAILAGGQVHLSWQLDPARAAQLGMGSFGALARVQMRGADTGREEVQLIPVHVQVGVGPPATSMSVLRAPGAMPSLRLLTYQASLQRTTQEVVQQQELASLLQDVGAARRLQPTPAPAVTSAAAQLAGGVVFRDAAGAPVSLAGSSAELTVSPHQAGIGSVTLVTATVASALAARLELPWLQDLASYNTSVALVLVRVLQYSPAIRWQLVLHGTGHAAVVMPARSVQVPALACDAGQTRDASGTQCVCNAGMLWRQGEAGAAQCIGCPAGTFSSRRGRARECSGCPAGTYSLSGAVTCSPCGLEGMECKNGLAYAKYGYWGSGQHSAGANASDRGSAVAFSAAAGCPYPHACLESEIAAGNTSASLCARGHVQDSPLCVLCEAGWRHAPAAMGSASACQACAPSSTDGLLLLAHTGVALLWIACMVTVWLEKLPAEPTTRAASGLLNARMALAEVQPILALKIHEDSLIRQDMVMCGQPLALRSVRSINGLALQALDPAIRKVRPMTILPPLYQAAMRLGAGMLLLHFLQLSSLLADARLSVPTTTSWGSSWASVAMVLPVLSHAWVCGSSHASVLVVASCAGIISVLLAACGTVAALRVRRGWRYVRSFRLSSLRTLFSRRGPSNRSAAGLGEVVSVAAQRPPSISASRVALVAAIWALCMAAPRMLQAFALATRQLVLPGGERRLYFDPSLAWGSAPHVAALGLGSALAVGLVGALGTWCRHRMQWQDSWASQLSVRGWVSMSVAEKAGWGTQIQVAHLARLAVGWGDAAGHQMGQLWQATGWVWMLYRADVWWWSCGVWGCTCALALLPLVSVTAWARLFCQLVVSIAMLVLFETLKPFKLQTKRTNSAVVLAIPGRSWGVLPSTAAALRNRAKSGSDGSLSRGHSQVAIIQRRQGALNAGLHELGRIVHVSLALQAALSYGTWVWGASSLLGSRVAALASTSGMFDRQEYTELSAAANFATATCYWLTILALLLVWLPGSARVVAAWARLRRYCRQHCRCARKA